LRIKIIKIIIEKLKIGIISSTPVRFEGVLFGFVIGEVKYGG